MQINGVPLHPLVVHAAVVFTPLAALAALGYCIPGWRDRLQWPLAVLAAISVVSVWVAFFSGQDLRKDLFSGATGSFAEKLEDHEQWAEKLRIGVTGFAILSFATAWFHTRSGTARTAIIGLTALAAIATLVLVYLTGDAGAQATWNAAG